MSVSAPDCSYSLLEQCLEDIVNCAGSAIPAEIISGKLPPCSIWRVFTACLPDQGAHCRFWWENTGHALATLMEKAGYNIDSQYKVLLFYYLHVVPEFGPSPCLAVQVSRWKSFMTDDFTPVEFSWSWGGGHEPPVIRFSVEPIGALAGTEVDPINEYAAEHFVNRLESLLPGTHLDWYHHFSRELLIDNQAFYTTDLSYVQEKSQHFVAFDLNTESITLRAYFIPTLKAKKLGKTRLDLVQHAVHTNQQDSCERFQQSYSTAFDFLRRNEQSLGLQVEILGIDRAAGAKSRLKVYFRSQLTSFNSVQRIMTLEGRLSIPNLGNGLKDLRRLWSRLLWNGTDFDSTSNLPPKLHRTSGILYYLEIRPGHPDPVPKVYIPVRPYSSSDLDVAKQVMTILSGGYSPITKQKYMEALEIAFPASSMAYCCRAHSYIACTIKDGSLNIISYINPGVYSHAPTYYDDS